ncbi:homoserine O-acetyltransferase [Candidatus Gastranaerophilus sp. (ex Termes propinquus)]|nr:homoserine O-acetyltransferase [Candidatus Gastranaerophilus sp. (ex Termes propinquus)]
MGLVETKYFNSNNPLALECGKTLPSFTVAYETYGELNENADNAILVLHALTADAHAAGYHEGSDKRGWWDDMIGPGKAFDTDKFFVISSNALGGCKGTTGPCSINPATEKPWGLDFPVITIEDMVKVQKRLVDFLGVKKLTVVGGSMGGMQALEWTVEYPCMVRAAIVIASTARLSAQSIGFNAIGRNAIISDKNFNNGNYYDKALPEKGLGIARMVGHITYLCEEAMHRKFGRDFKSQEGRPSFDFGVDFQVESYLDYQGRVFVDRFDANSYLYITKAVDYYDLAQKYGTLEAAFEKTGSKFLIISFSSDWLFTTEQSKEIVRALIKAQKDVSFVELQSTCGHDAFLVESENQTKVIKSFLREVR